MFCNILFDMQPFFCNFEEKKITLMEKVSTEQAPGGLRFRGVGTALVTPFYYITTEQGFQSTRVNYGGLKDLVERQINAGIDYLVVLGSTAETPTLCAEEKSCVMNTVRGYTQGRMPLVVGISSNNTEALCEVLRYNTFEGFDAILSACPCYNKPSQRGLKEHFLAAAKASRLPLILYNVPGRTGVNMLPETVVQTALEASNIIGIKEASGNKEQIRRLKALVDSYAELQERGFAIISGDDALTPELAQDGTVCGVISVLSNALPKQWTEIIHHCLNDKDYRYDQRYDALTELLFREGNPAGIKALLSVMGLCDNILRLPLTPVSQQLLNEIKAEAEKTH